MRRILTIAGVLVLLAYCLIGSLSFGEGLQDKSHAVYMFHRDSTDALIDTSYSATIRAFCSQCVDTTGTTIWAEYEGDSLWRYEGFAYQAYKILYESDSATIVLRDSFLTAGVVAPDTFITRSAQVGDTTIAAHAIQDGAVQPRHVDQDSSFIFSYDTTVDSLTANWVSSDSIWATWVNADTAESNKWVLFDSAEGDSLLADSLYARHAAIDSLEADSIWAYKVWCDTFFLRDSVIAYFEGAIFDSVYFPDDCVHGTGLDVTSGKIDIDTAPSSGAATLIEEEDALQVKYSTPLGEDAAKGLYIIDDGINTTLLKDANTPAESDLATFTTSNQINWETPTELNLPVVVGSGYAECPNGAVDTLMVYVVGALTSDDCLCSWKGEVPWIAGLNPLSFSVGCSVSVSDSMKVSRGPEGNRTAGNGDLTFFWLVMRNP